MKIAHTAGCFVPPSNKNPISNIWEWAYLVIFRPKKAHRCHRYKHKNPMPNWSVTAARFRESDILRGKTRLFRSATSRFIDWLVLNISPIHICHNNTIIHEKSKNCKPFFKKRLTNLKGFDGIFLVIMQHDLFFGIIAMKIAL